MNYEDISTFLEIVRTRNITKTAESLFISQSTVSNRLKNLEEECGFQLIVRSKGHRTIMLTRQGEAFLSYAERWKILADEIDVLKSKTILSLRLATNEGAFADLLRPFSKDFINRHPEYRLNIQVCDSNTVYDMIENDLVDFGLAAFDAYRPGISSELIYTQENCIIMNSSEPPSGSIIDSSALDPKKEICFYSGGYFKFYEQWYEKMFGPTRESRININSVLAADSFLESEGYWAFCPINTAKALSVNEDLKIYHLEENIDGQSIFLLKRNEATARKLPVNKDFENEFRNYMFSLRNNL